MRTRTESTTCGKCGERIVWSNDSDHDHFGVMDKLKDHWNSVACKRGERIGKLLDEDKKLIPNVQGIELSHPHITK